jgi:hypothetical protein
MKTHKMLIKDQAWGLMPEILATWEAVGTSRPAREKSVRPYLKNN